MDASQDRYGAQPLPVTSWLQSQTEMQSQADWLFSNFGTPQRHAEQVRIDAAAYPAAWELVLGVNIGDIVHARGLADRRRRERVHVPGHRDPAALSPAGSATTRR